MNIQEPGGRETIHEAIQLDLSTNTLYIWDNFEHLKEEFDLNPSKLAPLNVTH